MAIVPEKHVQFDIGQRYSRKEIHDLLGGAIVDYLPTKSGRILCGCFDLKKNQLAPEIVDFADAPRVVEQARIAAADRAIFPVFIKRASKSWEYVGRYQVDRLSTDPADLRNPRFRQDAVGVLYLSGVNDDSTSVVPAPCTWIFQGNPDTFRIDKYLGRTKQIRWTVRQEHLASMMSAGDTVYLWRAAGKANATAGVVAAGHIVRTPLLEEEDPTSRDLWTDFPEGRALRVRVDVDRVASARQVIKRDWLKADPVLSDLRILRLAAETNYQLSVTHAERLAALWSRTGLDWTEDEALAGLWAYVQTRTGEVSQLRDSPVANVALRIGRAVSGVYNKVMNFRSLDASTPGGLPGTSNADRAVWARYFDSRSGTLDQVRVDADFAAVWGGALQPSGRPSADAEQRERRRSIRGQGYEPDPEIRIAVERHAMELAHLHYCAQGFEVEDTSNRYPYDLRCLKETLELRVEVKGSRGDCSSVEVTIGEVENARGAPWRTDLYLVSRIEIAPGSPPKAFGGNVRTLENWVPNDSDLKATRFRYSVPG